MRELGSVRLARLGSAGPSSSSHIDLASVPLIAMATIGPTGAKWSKSKQQCIQVHKIKNKKNGLLKHTDKFSLSNAIKRMAYSCYVYWPLR